MDDSMKKAFAVIGALVVIAAAVVLAVSLVGPNNRYERRIDSLPPACSLDFTAKSAVVKSDYAIRVEEGEADFLVYDARGGVLFERQLRAGENTGTLELAATAGAMLTFVLEGRASGITLSIDATDLMLAAATPAPISTPAPAATQAPQGPNGGWRFG